MQNNRGNKNTHSVTRHVRVLGIDPGYERLGIAVVEKNGSERERLIFSECFKTSAKLPHATRLAAIAERLAAVIETYNPRAFAIEELFFSNNQKTALKVAEARGALIATAANQKIGVYEYSPVAVKIATTGYGRSDKTSVISMVKKLVNVPASVKIDDEFDAIAIALTHIATQR